MKWPVQGHGGVRDRILGPDHKSQDNVYSYIPQSLPTNGFLIQKTLKTVESFTMLHSHWNLPISLKEMANWTLRIWAWDVCIILFVRLFICVGEYVVLVQEPFSDSRGSTADSELQCLFLTAVEFWYAKYSFFPLIPAPLVWCWSQRSHFMRRILSQKLIKKSTS